MTALKRLAVRALSAACTALDRVGVDRLTHRHRLADWSHDLDERWGTQVWSTPPPDPDPVDPDPAEWWAFTIAMRDPQVRAELSARGYVGGTFILIGRDVVPDGQEPRSTFRVWRDPAVPGGWTGEPID